MTLRRILVATRDHAIDLALVAVAVAALAGEAERLVGERS